MNRRSTPVAVAAGSALAAGALTLAMLRPPAPSPRLLGDVLPGVTREMTCDPGYAQRVRHVTEAEKAEVFRRAGIPAVHRSLYEIDHIVPLALGGSNRIENLQAQPWDGPEGAHLKDRVEAWGYRQVCSGKLTIAEAQAIFRTPGGWQQALRVNHLAPPPPIPGVAPASMQPEDHDTEGFPR